MSKALIAAILLLTLPASAHGFTDNFTGAKGKAPNPQYWSYDRGGGGWGNKELQRYTASRSNSRLNGQGQLEIIARKTKRGYSSARLKSKGKVEFKYGTISIRAKLPKGKGLWPAFWMLGSDFPRVDWPYCGEIDIMENLGHNPNKIYGTVHGPGDLSDQGVGGFFVSPMPLSDGYHIYTAAWRQDNVAFLVDGVQYAEVDRENYPRGNSWAINKKMFIILNLAVGGEWPGKPNRQTRFPARLLIDSINVN